MRRANIGFGRVPGGFLRQKPPASGCADSLVKQGRRYEMSVLTVVLVAGPVLVTFLWVRRNGIAEARLNSVEQRAAEALGKRRNVEKAVTENSAAARRLSSVLRQVREVLASCRRTQGGEGFCNRGCE
jgi:hypothetical protein